MLERGIAALLVTDLENVRYLSGYTGSAGTILLTADSGVFFTDGRYTLQARDEVRDLNVVIEPGTKPSELNKHLQALDRPVSFEADQVTVTRLQRWNEEAAGVSFVPTTGIVQDLRLIKDPGEIDLIRQSVEIVDQVFDQVVGVLSPGMTEREVAIEIDFRMRRLGADGVSFDTIVASGPCSAHPHHHPTNRPLQEGDLVTMDFGALRQGYCSDITRTVAMGEPGPAQAAIYQAVLNAQEEAIDAVRPGMKGMDVDAVARKAIERAGYGEYFTHGLGHSLGREVHDGQAFGKAVEQMVAVGMVATIEPGIYVEGVGGVRIEDDVVVTPDGCEVLTRSPKKLLCI